MKGFLSEGIRDIIAVAGLILTLAGFLGTALQLVLAGGGDAKGEKASVSATATTKQSLRFKRSRTELFFAGANSFLCFLATFILITIEKRHPWAFYVYINTIVFAFGWYLFWHWLRDSEKPFLTIFQMIFFNQIAVLYYLAWLLFLTMKCFQGLDL